MWAKIILICAWTILASCFDLSGAVNGNRMAGVPLGISHGVGELDVEGICIQPGMACQNCTHSVTCVPIPGGWLKLPLEECPFGTTCNAHQRGCSQQPVPECDSDSQQFQHRCEQVGIFPDAYDCRKFHLCSPPEGIPDGRPADHRVALCPRHYGYNPQTAQCSIPLRNGQCEERPVPIPECKEAGTYGVLPASPNFYFVCLLSQDQVFYPQIFLCPHGWFFYNGYCYPEMKGIVPVVTTPVDSKESTEKTSEVITETVKDETTSTRSKIESFFSTERATTYAADTFLADKFDLSNYESTDDVAPSTNDDFVNSFENTNDFW
ncbi:uncharacterized protein LOC115441553 [Manduca sexta]|uniref:Chitin-binding type-2 domain-containing protein n=1 Tax=Manduca sexta TaxID=7130 RepID=A0A921YYA3_MANSE|nr:uncharacterized protein LOC115441553 [Manduca sexta]KAG6447114.1 hypothetical protein O3G_MSEX004773 [Manduca sexta]